MILGARVNKPPATSSAITAEATVARLAPDFASTSSAIEFGNGRGVSIRESSGSRIRK
jgi:hypothetical protein